MRPVRAVTALLGLALAGSLAAGVAPATAAEPDPLYGAPAVGDCYDVTVDQAWTSSPGEAPVDCSERHTLLVGAVGQVPDSVDFDRYRQLAKAAQKICDPFWDRYVTNRPAKDHLTLYQPIWFYATTEERAAGARWVSCEIGLRAGDRMVPLTTSGPPTRTRKLDDAVARCGTRTRYTPCSAKHSYRATRAFVTKARGGQKSRARAAVKAARKICPRKEPKYSGTYSWDDAGKNRIVVACYVKTRK